MSVQLLALAGAFLGWELLCRTGWIPDSIIPRPADVLGELAAAAVSGELFLHLGHTFRLVFLGFLLGASGGIALSLASFSLPYFNTATAPWIDSVMIAPKVVFIPYFVMLFGQGESFFLAAISFGVCLQVAVTLRAGLVSVDPDLVDMVNVLGARPRHVLTDVILPSLLPYLLLSVRFGVQQAVRQAILMEALFSMRGLGSKLLSSNQGMHVESYFAYLLLTMALGSGLVGLIERLLRRLAPWAKPA